MTKTVALVPTGDRYKGYSMGPGYWGKTMFVWPPDPRWGADSNTYGAANGPGVQPDLIHPTQENQDQNSNWICDWRRRFFLRGDGAAFNPQIDVWSSAYWLAVPLLVLNFAVFYSVSVFLSVWTRSTVASAFGVLLFWLLCWLVDYSHLRMLAQPTGSLSPLSQFLMDAGYWILPKPLDLSGIFFDAMNAETLSAKPEELKIAESGGQHHPEWSVASSLAFAAGVLGLSAYEFKMTDY